jgi:hypothetical protein
LKLSNIRKYVEPLAKAGYDLIPLKGKRPVHNDWVAKPKLSFGILQQSLKTKADNVGMRLGRELEDGRYLCVVDIDVVGRLTPEESTALNDALETVCGGVSLVNAPCVKTGYGNESRHIYVATSNVPRKSLLAKASRVVEYVKAGGTKTGPVWKIELMGYGAQVVIPPSIHPDTKATYRWIRELNGIDDIPTIKLKSRKSTTRVQRESRDLKHTKLLLSSYYQDLLVNGDVDGDYPSRSEALYAVLTVLVRDTDLNDAQIAEYVIRPEHKLGDKPRETNDPIGWLIGQIAKVRENSPTGGAMGLNAEIDVLTPDTPASAIRVLLAHIAESKLPALDEERAVSQIAKATNLSKSTIHSELKKVRPKRDSMDEQLGDDPIYKELCDRHSLVLWGGKPAVFRKRVDVHAWESRYDVLTLNALQHIYENKPVYISGKRYNPADLWRTSPRREEYLEGAVFSPAPEPVKPGYFNLWEGYAANPEPGSCKIFIDFVTKVICDGNEDYATWLLDWCADLFQDPANPKGVAVVMRGGEGIGKGTFANTLGHIVGPHYRHITQESQLTGRFNSHFADSTLVFGDEMTWGGEKRNKGQLYALVTERYLMIERKNFDAVSMRNLNRVVIASNNDWVVPTNIDGRRWFVLDPSEERKGDSAYFDKLNEWRLKGGHAKLLHYFLQRKITSNLRIAPRTSGLLDQKILALESVHAWWLNCLEEGKILPLAKGWPEAPLPRDQIYNAYRTWCVDNNRRDQTNNIHFFRRLSKVCLTEEIRFRTGDVRTRAVIFPDLDGAKQHFHELLGVPLTKDKE